MGGMVTEKEIKGTELLSLPGNFTKAPVCFDRLSNSPLMPLLSYLLSLYMLRRIMHCSNVVLGCT